MNEEYEVADKIKLAVQTMPMYSFPDTARFDVELKDKNLFRCVIVAEDGTVLSTLVGRVTPRSVGYAISFSEEPQLDLSEMAVWEPIYLDWMRKVEAAEEAGQQKFVLAEDGDFPQLFLPFVPNKTQYQLSQMGMIRILHSLEDALRLRGYEAYMMTKGVNGTTQFVATPDEEHPDL